MRKVLRSSAKIAADTNRNSVESGNKTTRVDIIKIDGIFIKNLDKNADDQLFVKALVDVAKGLNRQITAEFVENAEILALLRGYGVDFAQGYHIGHPQPALLDSTTWSESVSK